jgi:plasmid replication initiation protein
MANEIVKYHNDLNTVNMRGWTKEEMNFMFAVLSKAKEKGTELIEFDKAELTELARYSERHKMRLHDVLKNLVDHVTEMKYIEETTHSYEVMNLFQRFKVVWNKDYSEMHATIRLTSEFEYILNKLNANFTKFELEEFIGLRSTYAKQMYRLLKQWRTKGHKEWSVQDLRYLLAIPENYRSCDIDSRVLKPIKKELSKYFADFKVKPIKKRTKGNPIIAYEFKWKPEKTNAWIPGQPQPNPNKPKKLSGNEELPKWYSDTEQNEPTQEMLERIEKMKKELRIELGNKV